MGEPRHDKLDVLRLPIRAKLAAALAVPLLPILIVTVVEVRQASDEVAQVRTETRLANAAHGPTGVVNTLQNERSWTALALTGLESQYEAPVIGYEATREATDEAIDAFRQDIAAKGGNVEEIYSDAVAALEGIDQVRAEVDADTGPRTTDNMAFSAAAYDRQSEVIGQVLSANTRISLELRDVDLRRGSDLADLAGRQYEVQSTLTRETLVSALMSPNGLDTHPEIRTVSALLSTYERNNREIESAQGRYAEVVDEYFPAEMTVTVEEKVRAAMETGTVADLDSFLAGTISPPGEGFPALADQALEAVADRADTLDAQASARQRLFVVLAILAFAVAATMTWLVSQSITRPLRGLTLQAKDMAERRLPEAVTDILATRLGGDVVVPEIEPVVAISRDEIADVTEALNAVQASAVDLAVEQAVLRRNIADSFLNLGRRNQNLLGRQLDFITELESNETDPDALASLFRLDHLATRMRRNAESLLVLAGVEPARKWTAPVRLTDVIRAALGEVEDFERIRVEHVQPATVVGSTAADLAHLLAELVENSLRFSSPEDPVVVHGAWLGQDHYRLTVVDRGIGMTTAAIEQANRRLAGAEAFTVAPSKYLGHYVAGHLAARHGIGIELRAGDTHGVVTTIDLPPELCEAATDPRLVAPITGPVPKVRSLPPMPLPLSASTPQPMAPQPHPGQPVAPAAAMPEPLYPSLRPYPTAPTGPVHPAADTPIAPAAPAARANPGAAGDPGAPRIVPSGQGRPPLTARVPAAAPAEPSSRTLGTVPTPDVVDALSHHVRSHRTGPVPAVAPERPAPRAPMVPRGPVVPPPAPPAPAVPAAPLAPAARTLGAVPTAEELDVLRNHVRSLQTGPVPAVAAEPLAPADPSAGRSRLPQRVSGAQLPNSRPTRIRRPEGQRPADLWSGPEPPAPASAQDVYSFLSGFNDGVRRGLDETRRNTAS